MDSIQLASASVIASVLNGRNLNQILSETLHAMPELTAQQRGALQDLCYGTLRYYGQLGHILDALLSKPLQDINIRYLLLVALYQLQYTKAAQHAVVDFAVKAVRKRNPAASGLVNAILRNYLRKKSSLIADACSNDVGMYSYPQWWIKEVKREYGELAGSILQAGNLHPPMTLRVNSRRTTAGDYIKLLINNEIESSIISPEAILLQRAEAVDKLPGFRDGLVSVQDAGAQYAATLMDLKDGMRVLDACAAPGGKSAHMLELAQIELLALDKDAARLERVKENVQRLNLHAQLLQGDAAQTADWWDGRQFQRILADVPCSASGVVRRHPDIKWLRRPSDIEAFARQQLLIVQALWPLLERGGKMLYATCSIFARENQQVVDQFLNSQTDAAQLPIDVTGMKQGQLLPDGEHDGFFYALLQKQ